jgi:hypothetical protein
MINVIIISITKKILLKSDKQKYDPIIFLN